MSTLALEFIPTFFQINQTEVSITERKFEFSKSSNYHILTIAEAGFSMLDIYGRHHYGVDIEIIRQFADRINTNNESGSLHPHIPISAIPRKYFRDHESTTDTNILKEFQSHIKDFLVANRTHIQATALLIDFHVSSTNVPKQYINALLEEL